MPSEVGEVIDVMTRSGYLMYQVLSWCGWAAANSARFLTGLVQDFHRRYTLTGQVHLKALQRLNENGVPLATAVVSAGSLQSLREFAAGCAVPFAVTEVPGQGSIYVTFREQDVPVLAPVLHAAGARRLDADGQRAAWLAGADTGLPPAEPPPLCCAAVRTEDAQALLTALEESGVQAAAAPPSPELPEDCTVFLYPEPAEETVRRTLSALQLEPEFAGVAARPAGPERLVFADRRQRRASAEQEAAASASRSGPAREEAAYTASERRPEPAADLACLQVPPGEPAAALKAALAAAEVPAVRIETPQGPAFLAASQNASALHAALLEAGSGALRAATPQEAQAAASQLSALPLQTAAELRGPALAVLRDASSAGALKAAADAALSGFVRLAAQNPDLTAKNVFAALGQGADGHLRPAGEWMQAGGTIPAGAACIWTGEPRRDSAGRLLRRTDPETGAPSVEMDFQALVCAQDVYFPAGPPPKRALPEAELLEQALRNAVPAPAGTDAAELAVQYALREYRRRQQTMGPLSEAEAALSARILLERLALPVPQMPGLTGLAELRSALLQAPPTFAPFERARACAAAAAENLLSRCTRETARPAPAPER